MAPAADVPPRVLLGTLDPIVRVGVVRALLDAGASVIDGSAALVERAAESDPHVVVLCAADAPAGGGELRARLRDAAPEATLVTWKNAPELIEVLAPGASTPRLIPAPAAERLARELLADAADEGGPCPAT